MIQLVFLIGGWLLSAALLPAVLAGGGVPLETSGLTCAVLTAYTLAFLHMRQYGSAAGVGSNAVLWGVLMWQAVTA